MLHSKSVKLEIDHTKIVVDQTFAENKKKHY